MRSNSRWAGIRVPASSIRRALSSKREPERINGLLADFGLTCSASPHANPVHPNKRHAKGPRGLVRAVKLAPMLGTDIVITFSGCPGGTPTDQATGPGVPRDPRVPVGEGADSLQAQQVKLCRKHSVRVAWKRIGFCVYNPSTLIRLSETAGKAAGRGKTVLGANLDPSHFFWQGIDPILAA